MEPPGVAGLVRRLPAHPQGAQQQAGGARPAGAGAVAGRQGERYHTKGLTRDTTNCQLDTNLIYCLEILNDLIEKDTLNTFSERHFSFGNTSAR